jgi:glycosyltransferase involved in cell wall biosynthesis
MMLGKPSMSRRAALVHFKGDIDTVPALKSTVTLLARNGYQVDLIYVRDPAFLPPTFDSPQVVLAPLSRLPRGRLAALRRLAEALLWLSLTFCHCLARRPTYLIGVDPVGLIVCGLVGSLLRLPYVYFSLEIYLAREITSHHIRLMKSVERFFNRRSLFTVVQDQGRASLLSAENHVEDRPILLLPNSPLGAAQRRRSDYLRRKLNLPEEQKVILYAGALADWTYTPELIEAARDWPAEWTLVLHSRQHGNNLGLDFADYPWVKSSGGPVPFAHLPALVSSADVGLLLYRNADTPWQGDNMTYVGLSSGKLAQYLQCGLPVAAVAFPGLCEIIDRYHCGLCAPDLASLRTAIVDILANDAEYSRGAIQCFSEAFAFERHFEPILARLETVAS